MCGHGTHGDGLSYNPKSRDGNALKCFGCDFSGDIIDLYRAMTGATFQTAAADLAQMAGIPDAPQGKASGGSGAPGPASLPAGQGAADYSAQYAEWAAHITDGPAAAYLARRGISTETAARYGVGFAADFQMKPGAPASPRLIIPLSPAAFIARDIRDNPPGPRYLNTGAADLFNAAALYSDARAVYVVEGAIDALSIIEAGGVAVALNSCANVGIFLQRIGKRRPAAVIIAALDNDAPGREAQRKLCDGLTAAGVAYTAPDMYGPAKDANEALTADRAAFSLRVREEQAAAVRPDSVGPYLFRGMREEIARFKSGRRLSGFSNLDRQMGGIYPGLYVLAAISSLGKTTFAAQMADNMATAGNDVIIFSLEQSRLEIVSKNLARRMAQSDAATAFTSLKIRTGAASPELDAAARQYARDVGERLSIIEGNFSCDGDYIRRYVTDYTERTGARPMVIIDYLQILQPGKSGEAGRTTKEKIDLMVTELKRLSRALDLVVLVIASVNRSNYLAPVDFEGLKESGGIEYTADVIWGLQLSVMNGDLFMKEKDTIKKREAVKRAKAATPRHIELVCLKNRFGAAGFSVFFDYFPALELFRPYFADFSVFGETVNA